jgi:filamentous hemagglutinin family protein
MVATMKIRQQITKISGHNGVRFGMRRRLLNSLVVLLCAAGPALALPTGSNPVVGITQNQIVTNGKIMTITNNSVKAIVDWNTFSIATGETVKIDQAAQSIFLSRVTGGVRSEIFGALQSDGKVFLINRNGILFGAGAVVNVNGLVASTLNISNEDFLAGKMKFTTGAVAGTVENQGTISTPSGGQVYLIAPDVKNSGVITAPNGDILLAAGREILLVDSASPEIALVVSAPEHQAINLGTLTADAGRIGLYGGIVRQKGIVSANSAVKDASGRIFLKATKEVAVEAGSTTTANGLTGGSVTLQATEGTTLVSGTIETKGTEGAGGTVHLLGQYVGLLDNAVVDVSSTAGGGGTVLVGGDYRGQNVAVQNALATYMGSGATIKADAVEKGNGGKVVLWSDGSTRSYGKISVWGGAEGGDGGFVETSGHYLDVRSAPDTSAPKGKGGLWLLDPDNITISTSDSMISSGPLFQPTNSGGSSLDVAVLKSYLENSGDAIIDTAYGGGMTPGDITFASALAVNLASGRSLTLNADNNIVVNANITATGSALNLNLNAGRTTNGSIGVVSPGPGTVAISLNGGSLVANAKTGVTIGSMPGYDANISAGTINITNQTSGNITVNAGSALQTSSGLISMTNNASTAKIYLAGLVNAGSGMVSLQAPEVWFHATDMITPLLLGSILKIASTDSTKGVMFDGGKIGNSSTQSIEFMSDMLTVSGGGTAISTSTASVQNEVQLTPYTANTTIGVVDGSGAFNISQALLDTITSSTLVIGKESGAGTVAGDISASAVSWNNGQRLALLSGGSVTGNGITATKLGVIAGGAVNITNSTVGSIAIKSAGGGVTFENSAGFSVVSEIGGVTNPTTISGIFSNGADINLTAASGDIWIGSPVDAGAGAVGITASSGGIYTSSGGAVNVIGGSFSGYAGTNIGGADYSLMTKTPLWSTLHTGGSLYLDNIGAVSTGSSLVDVGSVAKLTAHSPLTVGIGGLLAGGDITLEASPMGSLDDLTINGPVTSSAGNIYLRAGNQIIENAAVSAVNGSITRTQFLNGSGTIIPANLQPQPPAPPLYGDDSSPAGLLLVAEIPADTQGDNGDDKDKDKDKHDADQEQRSQSGDKKNDKPKKNYCN